MKMKLEGVQETLLIPLIAKANETKSKTGKLRDDKAVEMVSKIEYDLNSMKKTERISI